MKIRNHKNKIYQFYPNDWKEFGINMAVEFKYKKDLMKFLQKNGIKSLNGRVGLRIDAFTGCFTEKMWTVWYNERDYKLKKPFKVELRVDKRHRTFSKRFWKISKEEKRWSSFSERVLNLMWEISRDTENITKSHAKNLVKAFYKRGFEDFQPDREEQAYIDRFLKEGIEFSYWSDRCNNLRAKTIIEYFKTKNLLN